MSIVEKFFGFFVGVAMLALGGGIIWGLVTMLEILVASFGGAVMSNLMLIILALPVAYGLGNGYMENRSSSRGSKM